MNAELIVIISELQDTANKKNLCSAKGICIKCLGIACGSCPILEASRESDFYINKFLDTGDKII